MPTISPTGEFAVTADPCTGTTVAAGGSCVIQVKFTPSNTGSRSAMAVVSATPGGTASTTLMGTGLSVAMITIAPTPYDYGTVDVGTTATKTFTVTNNGQSPTGALTIRESVNLPINIANDTCTNQVLAAGASCTFDGQFQPGAYGSYSGSLQASASPGGTVAASVSGTGRDYVTLTIMKTGTGSGSVTSTDTNINCGTVCTAQYARTSSTFATVTLNGAAAAGSTFTGFSGANCSGTTCTVTMSQAQTVTATFTIKTVNVNVVLSPGGATGVTVTSSDGNINCGANCSHTYNWTTSTITLTANPGGTNVFLGWSGVACGPTPTCTFDLTQDRNVTASFSTNPQRSYIFVTSTTYLPTQINGLAGADALCQARANAVGLPGTYSAWLSDNTTSANTRVGQGGWIRTDGRPFAPALSSLTASPGAIYYPPSVDELGNNLAGTFTPVFVGSDNFGRTFNGNNCTNWTSNSGSAYVGIADGISGYWSYSQVDSCGSPHRLYCMRSDVTVAIPAPMPPPGARYAFTSQNPWSPSTSGISAADAQCQNEAVGASLPTGTYIALLATSTASAASRLNLAPGTPPFRRPDGTLVVATPGDLAAGNFLSVPFQNANGTYGNSVDVWTGSPAPGMAGSATTTCSNWTSTTGNGGFGDSSGLYSWWNFFTPQPCTNTAFHVYCFQQ
jgi:hypothetical protein